MDIADFHLLVVVSFDALSHFSLQKNAKIGYATVIRIEESGTPRARSARGVLFPSAHIAKN